MALISSIDDNIYVHDAMKYILTVKHYAVIKNNVYKEFLLVWENVSGRIYNKKGGNTKLYIGIICTVFMKKICTDNRLKGNMPKYQQWLTQGGRIVEDYSFLLFFIFLLSILPKISTYKHMLIL